MSSHSRFVAPLALTLALVAGACKDKSNTQTLSQDSTLSRDLALANQDSASQPQLQDVPSSTATPATTEPAKPAPTTSRPATTSRPKPKPRPAPTKPAEPTKTASGNTVTSGTKGSEGAIATIPAGSVINLASNDRICTNTNKAGDRFTASVTDAVSGSNGAVIPAGAKAVVQVTELKRSENSTQPIQMTFSVLSLSWNGKTYPVNATIDSVGVEKVRNSSKGNDAKKVVGGAVIGAILGQVIGHNTKSTVIGAAGGAAAGTAVAMGTANYEGCVPNGGAIRIKLVDPATIQTE
jgi:hypothetical protein